MELDNLPLEQHGNILVVTGWRGVGKTKYCRKIADRFVKQKRSVSGLLTPGRYNEKGEKNGIYAVNLSDGESRLFGSRVQGEINGLDYSPWIFDEDVMAWGNRVLSDQSATDLLIIDELGPLEFEKNLGWTAAFDLLKQKIFGIALVVIRPECMQAFSRLGLPFSIKEIAA